MQDQWISYNDVSDIRSKVKHFITFVYGISELKKVIDRKISLPTFFFLQGKYIKDNHLGGALVWSLDLDDFVNVCGCGPNPLLFAINDELSEVSHRTDNTIENCT